MLESVLKHCIFVDKRLHTDPEERFKKKASFDMNWYDMIWYDMIWYDMIWYAELMN